MTAQFSDIRSVQQHRLHIYPPKLWKGEGQSSSTHSDEFLCHRGLQNPTRLWLNVWCVISISLGSSLPGFAYLMLGEHFRSIFSKQGLQLLNILWKWVPAYRCTSSRVLQGASSWLVTVGHMFGHSSDKTNPQVPNCHLMLSGTL